jgi:hypothetical protein
MNGTPNNYSLMNRLMKWPALCGLAGLLLAQTVPAGQDYYINNDVVTNPGNIDATNFINNNSFSANYGYVYETTDTLNYTNNDTMTSSGGFLFDTHSGGGRSMAANFYNPGSITGYVIVVNATNLVSPGSLEEGENGLMQLTGQNVNLSYATITMPLPTGFITLPGTGDFGTDTNGDWDPSAALTMTSAYSSEPNSFLAAPSVAYTQTDPVGTNVIIYRSIFLNNVNTNVGTKVYFGQVSFGNGAANVEWIGIYTNPATGVVSTNYLILNNDYVLGASTNLNLSQGYPNNFQFSTDPNSVAGLPPGSTGMPSDPYPVGAISNVYSYASVQVVPTTVSPGPTSQNPSGALTNLPGRIQISASRELNLALANITGPNYLSLTCTNQFDGNLSATIVSPYSDINLGVTNGFLVVSNVLQSVLPSLSGTIQAWSTEFLYANTNSGSTVTDDFRVLIVSSSLVPFSTAQVQDLTLHSTNLLVCDALNIMRNVSIDAKSLTLATNIGYPNIGAGSPDGELNLESSSIFFASSLPNLLWLTNNGKITTGNAGNFGGPSPANYQNFINRGIVSDQGSTIYSSYFFNSGTIANGLGNFYLQSQSGILTNGSITATGDIAITSSNLVASKVQIQAGRSLTLQVTNLLTDNGATNVWSVGASSLNGLNLPILPTAGDLHGTTISVLAGANKNVVNTWAGKNWGGSAVGYVNNASLGGLILNGSSVPPHSLFTFNGTGANNALYVKNLFLTNTAATLNSATKTATALAISPNLVIYYQNAYSNGVPVSGIINGWNNSQLLWVTPSIMAQTNIVVPPPSLSASGFIYTVSGVLLPNASALTTNASYNVIVQTSTNLSSAIWVNTYTGTPPFTYTDFGYTNNLQQFYRSKQGW